jgi:hypothetical protein
MATVPYLLARLSPLHVPSQTAVARPGLLAISVIRWLKALNIPFLMPAVIRGKTDGTRAWCCINCMTIIVNAVALKPVDSRIIVEFAIPPKIRFQTIICSFSLQPGEFLGLLAVVFCFSPKTRRASRLSEFGCC